jgi:hypothetical protein
VKSQIPKSKSQKNPKRLNLKKEILALGVYVTEQARVADANSRDWQPDQVEGITNLQAAYRSGMWFAYHDVKNHLEGFPTDEPKETECSLG